MRTLVWFRNDLRTADHPALHAACSRGEAVALFLVCASQWRAHDVGQSRLQFLARNLRTLAAELTRLNIPLQIAAVPRFRDVPRHVVTAAKAAGATAVSCNEEYPLNERVRDSKTARACSDAGIEFQLHHAGTILPPGRVLTANGEPYTMFTPFKRRWLGGIDNGALEPLPRPEAQAAPRSLPAGWTSDPGAAHAGLDPGTDDTLWPPGETFALQKLEAFVAQRIRRYDKERNVPSRDGTSGLSPYLSIGVVSPRQCLHAAASANGGQLAEGDASISTWITELVWRDFYRHIVAQFPHVSRGQAFKRETDSLPWRDSQAELQAWQRGMTGFPLVDAAMRQLNETGWMHNRLRMVSAMFLAKHLLLDWRAGERYFMNKLVDGDFAANNGGWQWSASTGTDAAPYFRIFNPTTQAQRFDPDADFIKRFVPELEPLTPKQIFTEPSAHCSAYPAPIVEHRFARERAIAMFKAG